jgi:hypothetical protein
MILLLTTGRSANGNGDLKAISQVASGLLGAVTNVAGAILDDGTIIANNVAGEESALEATTLAATAGLAGGAASATSVMRDLNIAVSQGMSLNPILAVSGSSASREFPAAPRSLICASWSRS